jgi:hypothetical protein
MLSAIPWAVGFILLGLVTIKTELIAKWTVWISTIDALRFWSRNDVSNQITWRYSS